MKKNISYYCFILLLVKTSFIYPQTDQLPKTIMISPAGDAKHTGRKFPNNYERAITFKIAEQLQKNVEQRYNIRTILTRVPGEEVVHLQNASFANRLNVKLFLQISVYKEENEKPRIYLYHLVRDPIADFARRTFPTLTFTPINQAHLLNIHQTKSFGERIKMVLSAPENQALFDFSGILGLPLKQLDGMVPPALLLEIGINNEGKIAPLLQPLVDSLKFITEY